MKTHALVLLGFAFGALIPALLAPSEEVRAAGIARGMASDCGIDNNDAVEANVIMSTGEFYNNDATSDAKLQCRIPAGSAYGINSNDFDNFDLYVYDGHSTEAVSATLGTHGTGTGVWTTCGTDTSTGNGANDTLNTWSTLSTCDNTADRMIFVSVTLPDSDTTTSRLIGWYVETL